MNVTYTFLETVLLAIMYSLYMFGLKSNSLYKKKNNLILGISGDSGAGKSMILSDLSMMMKGNLVRLEGDGEHKWERGNENWNFFTHADPKANFIHKQADVLDELKHHRHVLRMDYDHTTGKFMNPVKVVPREFVAISGLHVFYLPRQRKLIDVKIFMDTEESLRRFWKLKRDQSERGYQPETVLEQMEKRTDDTMKYIAPQKNFADMIVRFFSLSPLTDFSHAPELGLYLTLTADIHLEQLILKLDKDVKWDYNDDLKTQYLELRNDPGIDLEMLAHEMIPNVNEILHEEHEWQKGYRGLIQFLVLLLISEKMKDEA